MEDPITMEIEEHEVSILKQKKPRKPLDPETKKKMSDHMKKVNQDRIEKARIASVSRLEKKEEAIAEIAMKKLESIERKKQGIRKLKEDRGIVDPIPDPIPEPIPEPPKSKPRPKTRKQVIIECSSDSSNDETDSESDTELIYVQKKKAAKKSTGITKSKGNKTPVEQPAQEQPRTIIKFI